MANVPIGDRVAARLREIAASMGGGNVQVGFMDGATYPDGTLVAAVAADNEYGHGGDHPSPPRPFFRGMVAKESPAWPATMAKLAKATNYDGPRVLELMGEDIEGALKQSINDFTTPGLAEATIKRKGFSKPLIDTAHMLNSTSHKVNK